MPRLPSRLQRPAGAGFRIDQNAHRVEMSESVKGFGCRPHDWRRGRFGRPASESLQRRKPRWGDVGWCRV